MAVVQQQFAVRGSEGLFVYDGISESPKELFFEPRTNPIGCRLMSFSSCGKFLAYCDGEKTAVLDTSDWKPRLTLPDLPSTTQMYFSPKSNFFCAWHPFKGAVNKPKPPPTTNNDSEKSEDTSSTASATAQASAAAASGVGKPNLKIFNLQTMQLAAEFIEKNQKHWHPCWTEDEVVFGRLVGSELLFHQNDFGKYSTKFVVPKLDNFSISPGPVPYHVASYVPGGNKPANVRIYRYPEFQQCVANKTFFKADSVSFTWNKRGNALIIMALTEVNSTGKSYYGETNLYLICTNGDSSLLQLGKPGPVYHVDWNPNSTEFCVVYGYMPAKATLYNLKGDALFDFGTGPRNEVQYNPRGDILCLCGFGNLRGNVEFWTWKNGQQKKSGLTQAVKFTAEDTTIFRWSPDGRHFASATTAPRLRVNNGYKIWDASGHVIFEHKTPAEQEMWEVAWRPVPISAFSEAPLDLGNSQQNAVGGSGKGAAQQKPQPAAYVPPHLRGVPTSNRPAFKLHDDEEPATNVKEQQQDQDANLSKQALKNRKRRELQKTRPPLTPGPTTASGAGINISSDVSAPDAETQKKVKNIMKKLEQISALKKKMEAGEKLEANQVEKIQKEGELLKELEDLQI